MVDLPFWPLSCDIHSFVLKLPSCIHCNPVLPFHPHLTPQIQHPVTVIQIISRSYHKSKNHQFDSQYAYCYLQTKEHIMPNRYNCFQLHKIKHFIFGTQYQYKELKDILRGQGMLPRGQGQCGKWTVLSPAETCTWCRPPAHLSPGNTDPGPCTSWCLASWSSPEQQL